MSLLLCQLQCTGQSPYSRQWFQNWRPAKEASLHCPQQLIMKEGSPSWATPRIFLPSPPSSSSSLLSPREGSSVNDHGQQPQQWERWVENVKEATAAMCSLFFSDGVPEKTQSLMPSLGRGERAPLRNSSELQWWPVTSATSGNFPCQTLPVWAWAWACPPGLILV